MDIKKLHGLSKSLLKLLDRKILFEIVKEPYIYTIKMLDDHEFEIGLDSVLNFARTVHEQLEIQDLLHTDQISLDTAINLQIFFHRYVKVYRKKQKGFKKVALFV